MPVTSGVSTDVSRDCGRLAPVHALTMARPGGMPGAAATGTASNITAIAPIADDVPGRAPTARPVE